MGSPSGVAHDRGSAMILSVMPSTISVAGLTSNGLKDRRLAPQITINLSNMLCPHSHTAWETS